MNTAVAARMLSCTDFLERMRNLSQNVLQLASDYVFTLDARPEFKKELVELGFPRQQLQRLEMLGRGQISPKLVFESGRWVSHVMRLPLSDQEAFIEGGVEVLSPDGADHRVIKLEDLSQDQLAQVFGPEGVRTLAAQRTYLEERERESEMKRPVEVPELVWKIRRGRVIITKPCELTARQLSLILAEMQD